MAIDRQRLGVCILRVTIGLFFLFEGLSKWRWLANPSILGAQLSGWLHALDPASMSARYLERVAIPFVRTFARLVPLGEIGAGLALIVGVWTPVVAALAFVMVLNFHFASGALFKFSFLSNGYGLPVLGSTLALALTTRLRG
jgi:uncharacterized membrane protein YphA (DoxX/SURF4 family)